MKLTGVHLLLTYSCTLECDHCFVWGSPWQSGTLRLREIETVLQQAVALGTVEWIYFEGGEPFLYYAVLLRAVRRAAELGFRVGIVSNAYWATDVDDAVAWLQPFKGLVQDLAISRDDYHRSAEPGRVAEHAVAAAQQLGISVGLIEIAEPEAACGAAVGQLPTGESAVMYRGRAAQELVSRARRRSWEEFTECPYEDLRDPGRVHVDPLGHVHICQGISLGNLRGRSLDEICRTYDPDGHPVVGPLLTGGPAELVRQFGLAPAGEYADACHLCYESRRLLRTRFPETLTPDQMYGVAEGLGSG